MAIELSTTAPTEFVEANGIKYAYRRLGQSAESFVNEGVRFLGE